MAASEKVKLSKIIKKMQLVNKTPQIDTRTIWVHQPDVNRPALQLAGFYDHFDNERIQVIGYVEQAYLDSISADERKLRYTQLLSSNIPCVVFCRDLEPE